MRKPGKAFAISEKQAYYPNEGARPLECETLSGEEVHHIRRHKYEEMDKRSIVPIEKQQEVVAKAVEKVHEAPKPPTNQLSLGPYHLQERMEPSTEKSAEAVSKQVQMHEPCGIDLDDFISGSREPLVKFVEDNYPLPEKPESLPEDSVKELERKRHSVEHDVSFNDSVRKAAKCHSLSFKLFDVI
ncbi:hypothetical protein Tco_0687728 [Tanacetum coccineum]